MLLSICRNTVHQKIQIAYQSLSSQLTLVQLLHCCAFSLATILFLLYVHCCIFVHVCLPVLSSDWELIYHDGQKEKCMEQRIRSTAEERRLTRKEGKDNNNCEGTLDITHMSFSCFFYSLKVKQFDLR